MENEEMPQEEVQEASDAPTSGKSERGPDVQVLFVTDKGYGVRTNLNEFRKAHRGTKGTRAVFLNEKNGKLLKGIFVADGATVAVMTKNGQAGLFSIDQVRLTGRGLAGVRLVTLDEGDEVVDVLAI